MNSVVNRYSRAQAPSPAHCEPKVEKCSTCGMLECLCRPRFFAGQVLTADDLNRLEHYIIGKNRLHNRQLHGWGVVNGLEVTCDACGKGVVVGCGYALSPCGDDIVVCEPVTVDVCALIKACKQAERQPCEPPRQPPTAGCDGESEWVLAIRYTESPARGIKPMMPSTTAGCGCSSSACTCGGSTPAKSGCGCGGSSSGRCNCTNGATKAKPRTAPVQCEPTIICEGFAFDVYRKPPDPAPGDSEGRIRINPDSELYKRFQCCVELLLKRIPKMPGPLNAQSVQQNLPAWQQWTCTFKDYLQFYLSTKPGYNCELLARLNLVLCPPLNSPNAAALVLETIVVLLLIWLDALLACFCSALLPPCPEAYPNGCVPLATVRVASDPCRVLSICNWTTHRKFATTFPALQYWLSILPFGAELRRLLDKLCCFQINMIPPTTDTPGTNVPGTATQSTYERASKRLNPRADNPERLKAASRITLESFARGATPFDPQTFIESAFLAEKDKGQNHLSATDLDNLPQFLALNQLLRPIAIESLPAQSVGSIFTRMAFGDFPAAAEESKAGPGESAPAPDVAALREDIERMRADIERQAQEINRLKKHRKGKG